MTLLVLTIQDTAVSAYLPVFCVPSERDAIFQLEAATNDPSTAIYKSPSDYNLIQLGEFDQRSGKLTTLEIPKIISNASKHKKD